MTLLSSCGGQQLADGGDARRATPASTLSGRFSIIEATGMSAEDEREVLSLNPIQLDTIRPGPANTTEYSLTFTDRVGGRFGTWYQGADGDSLFWRVADLFGGINFAGILDGSTFRARVYGAGDIEPQPTEMGHVRAERVHCPGAL